MSDLYPIKRALISVSDKTEIVKLADALVTCGVEIISTGGSAEVLRASDIPVKDVSDLTGFPEIMNGRVKTLHPRVHGGLLALRNEKDHILAMKQHEINEIDLLVVNLYPFQNTVARGADYGTCIENIDIGGPAMIRAAAKNHQFVTVITDYSDYDVFLDEFKKVTNTGEIITTHANHIPTKNYNISGKAFYRDPVIASLDGNTVELSVEQMQFAENTMKYQTTLKFLNGKITKMISAIRGE